MYAIKYNYIRYNNWKKYTVSIKFCCKSKKSLFVLNATAESVDCTLSFEKHSKTFLQFDSRKDLVKHIVNLPQHLLKKIIGDNL